MTAVALCLPLAAMGGKPATGSKVDFKSYVAPGLEEKAAANPDATLHLIVQSAGGVSGAEAAFGDVEQADKADPGKLKRRLGSIGAVSVDIKARKLDKLVKLAEKEGLIITPDARVKMASLTSSQLWTEASGVTSLWSKDAITCAVDALGIKLDPLCQPSTAVNAPQAPAIAIVDSGIDPRADFGDRLLASVSLVSGTGINSPGDGRGHGTMVAGLAAGSGAGFAGAAPNAGLVSLDVIDDAGAGRASDIIAAADWILANKATYNIRVANFSLGVGNLSSFRFDPVNKAVERLWFAGVTVVASAGNYGTTAGPSGVKYAPGNDPFVITVGAADLGGTALSADDTVAPWSSWGGTSDGFSKPEVVAPGRYMVSAAPTGSALYSMFPERVQAPGYLRMSGTSFSAAVISGVAAQILARHPGYTPDEVKGALMVSRRVLPLVTSRAAGVGEVDAAAAAVVSNAPNPNLALNAFVLTDASGRPAFDQAAWVTAVRANPTSWDAATWLASGWLASGWLASGWLESSWLETTWLETTWLETTWLESTWLESTWLETSWTESIWSESTLDP